MEFMIRQIMGRRRLRKRLTLTSFCFICSAFGIICFVTIFMHILVRLKPWIRKDTIEPEHFGYSIYSKDYFKQQNQDSLQIGSMHRTRALLQIITENTTIENTSSTRENKQSNSAYPEDLFSEEQLKNGFIVFHAIGVLYMFVAIAITCDEFFVPSLEVITEKLSISQDVAGATFMAAGGSTPELFTNIIAVFWAESDVGIGTIVGSAVFNILFVIGMCALCSIGVLTLTWWPLFRDVAFYSLSLILLILFFTDKEIMWYEASILFCCYIAYVVFMKFNEKIERAVKDCLYNSRKHSRPAEVDSNQNGTVQNGGSHQNSRGDDISKFRQGLLHLLIHTVDPMTQAAVKEEETEARLETMNGTKALKERRNTKQCTQRPEIKVNGTKNSSSNGNGAAMHDVTTATENGTPIVIKESTEPASRSDSVATISNGALQDLPFVDEAAPLDMSWPKTTKRRIMYIFLAPIIFPLAITLPDVRNKKRQRLYVWTFLGSMMWIGFFAFLMNWWAATIGNIAGIPESVMGLTFLAAGTSMPDMITSVIVTKKGYGDMAISSSVGSNIFDVTVGLPLPWLVYGLIYNQSYNVDSEGMLCSVMLLFAMLIVLIIAIATFKWKMNKGMGIAMFFMYAVFLTLSLLLIFGKIQCPDISF